MFTMMLMIKKAPKMKENTNQNQTNPNQQNKTQKQQFKKKNPKSCDKFSWTAGT